ncbi:hypothetical protein H480_08298 [Amycolatopsis vancoresmycina DSM 44592]|uniref:Uncharacterized protein n=1 Tax=Amycolatopsis vancoresmycina DSM 44592 TaxID=1292037 RepID=R1IF83_9PSEU|nr:hypothetical protein H480_08298 [Amycolatopsis vancoresmycina DSM 44592]
MASSGSGRRSRAGLSHSTTAKLTTSRKPQRAQSQPAKASNAGAATAATASASRRCSRAPTTTTAKIGATYSRTSVIEYSCQLWLWVRSNRASASARGVKSAVASAVPSRATAPALDAGSASTASSATTGGTSSIAVLRSGNCRSSTTAKTGSTVSAAISWVHTAAVSNPDATAGRRGSCHSAPNSSRYSSCSK